jgi:hypothetical protein
MNPRRLLQGQNASAKQDRSGFFQRHAYKCIKGYLEELDSRTIERLGKQSSFLLGPYEEELAKDPASRARESSRSNVIALWHTIRQIYDRH